MAKHLVPSMIKVIAINAIAIRSVLFHVPIFLLQYSKDYFPHEGITDPRTLRLKH